MLSPLEFATLMLVKDSADQIVDRDELARCSNVNSSPWSNLRAVPCPLALRRTEIDPSCPRRNSLTRRKV
jgi:hypothetical protein